MPLTNTIWGITAESVAEEYGISREEQDALALESQKRAVAAIESGRFKRRDCASCHSSTQRRFDRF